NAPEFGQADLVALGDGRERVVALGGVVPLERRLLLRRLLRRRVGPREGSIRPLPRRRRIAAGFWQGRLLRQRAGRRRHNLWGCLRLWSRWYRHTLRWDLALALWKGSVLRQRAGQRGSWHRQRRHDLWCRLWLWGRRYRYYPRFLCLVELRCALLAFSYIEI